MRCRYPPPPPPKGPWTGCLTPCSRRVFGTAVGGLLLLATLLPSPAWAANNHNSSETQTASSRHAGQAERALWPREMSHCAAGDAILVASDANAQSDVYAAAILSGALRSRCIVDAGARDNVLPKASLDALSAGVARVYVVGGVAAIPERKIDQISRAASGTDITRISGSNRWATALYVGEYASSGILPDEDELNAPSGTSRLETGSLWPTSMDQCSDGLPVLVASDTSAQSDIYAAVTLAGVIGTRCLVDAGHRHAALPFNARKALAVSLDNGYVVGGTASVSLTKVAGHSLDRLNGVDRWQTARKIGEFAAGFVDASQDSNEFAKVATGPNSHACALRVDGSVRCWRGTSHWEPHPTNLLDQTPNTGYQILPSPNVAGIDLAVGSDFACALLKTGTPSCWQMLSGEQLDIGNSGPALRDLLAIRISLRLYQPGRYSDEQLCGLKTTGKLNCFSFDNNDAFAFDGRYDSFTTGDSHICATHLQQAHCFGKPSGYIIDAPRIEAVEVSAGSNHTCVLTPKAKIDCLYNDRWEYWDLVYFGLYGRQLATIVDVPTGNYRNVVSGPTYACGLLTNGSVVCWGGDWHGETTAPRTAMRNVSAASGSACGVRHDGSVACWGLRYTTASLDGDHSSLAYFDNIVTGVVIDTRV